MLSLILFFSLEEEEVAALYVFPDLVCIVVLVCIYVCVVYEFQFFFIILIQQNNVTDFTQLHSLWKVVIFLNVTC